jgi:NAD(P)-dependent dehydrogenase (short-subunit alcohol dehydrogenase family)
MQLNYFGAIRMAMNLLPQMRERRGGHIINVSTVGVQNAPPRFSAYLGSKFALEGWTMAAATEFVHENIHFSLVNYPLVRTPMIAPTKIYDYFPALSPEQAVNWLCEVIVKRPKRKTTPFGLFSLFMYYAFPKTAEFIVNTGYQVVPETFGKSRSDNKPDPEQPVPDNVKPLKRKSG